MAQAERDAAAHEAPRSYLNAEGKQVRSRYLGACDAFEMRAEPGSGIEVYSAMRLVGAELTADALTDLLLGPEMTDTERARRRRYEPDLPDPSLTKV